MAAISYTVHERPAALSGFPLMNIHCRRFSVLQLGACSPQTHDLVLVACSCRCVCDPSGRHAGAAGRARLVEHDVQRTTGIRRRLGKSLPGFCPLQALILHASTSGRPGQVFDPPPVSGITSGRAESSPPYRPGHLQRSRCFPAIGRPNTFNAASPDCQLRLRRPVSGSPIRFNLLGLASVSARTGEHFLNRLWPTGWSMRT